MFMFTTLLLLAVTVALFVYSFFRKSYQFFENAGIPYIKPQFIFGNMKNVILLKESMIIHYKKLYEQLEPHRIAGLYTLHKPSIMIRDPELIKNILVKDFSHFNDHGFKPNKDVEPLSNHLFSMSGDEWKNLRIKLTGTFTTGKMKMMFPLFVECAEKIKIALEKTIPDPDGFDCKDLCARYTTDVIGSCAFGIETHSLEDPDSEFRNMGKGIFKFRWQGIVRMLFPDMTSAFIKFFRLQLFDPAVSDYFMKTVKDMVKYREENNVTRGDFLDLLIAMKNHKELEKIKDQKDDADLEKFLSQIGNKCIKNDVEMTIELMAAQCFLFFVGGFDTSSGVLSFILLELSRHPEIQNKAREEVLSVLSSNDGTLTYDMLKKLTYLNMIVAETLRRYPPAGILMRKCTQNYKIPDTDFIIKEGTAVIVPAYGLHYDKKYFEKPDEFYPEHFSEEAKAKRPHFAYLPFGEGPRICIAERFAKMQVLIGAVYLLKDFSFELSHKTKLPLEFLPVFGSLAVKGGAWVKCKRL